MGEFQTYSGGGVGVSGTMGEFQTYPCRVFWHYRGVPDIPWWGSRGFRKEGAGEVGCWWGRDQTEERGGVCVRLKVKWLDWLTRLCQPPTTTTVKILVH